MASEPALHGRDIPLAALAAALDDAFDGRGGLVLVTGEPGIGKTTLATAIARVADARGAAVTWGRAWEFADAPPYFPVRPCLRAIDLDAHGDAFELWEQVLARLSRATAPVVWIVEDLHAADLGSLDLLTFLAQPIRALRVLIVATARAHDPRVSERMLRRLARMGRDGVELRLEPLDRAAVAAAGADALGRAIPRDALARLVELTGGNPLFVVECARAWRLAGAMDRGLAVLPPTVRQVVVDRVALLPDATRDALACAAVVGREFATAVVARMIDAMPAQVVDALLPALRSGVIKEVRAGELAFSHTLVRDAIDDALESRRRVELHGRAATALVGDTAEVVVERARHAIAAGADGALALATAAMELLERDGAHDRAFELYTRVEVAGLVDDPAMRLHAARVARAAGRTDASRRLCDEVMARARAIGDAELLARGALLAFADIRPGVIDRQQVMVLAQVRAELGDRAPALGVRVLARLATALQPAPDPAVPHALAVEAHARAIALGDAAAIIDVLEVAGWGIYDAPIAERKAWAEELRDRAMASADLARAVTAHGWLASHHIEASELDAFDREVTSMLVLADELGHPRHRWRALLFASSRAMSYGSVAESDRHVTEVEQLAPLADDPALVLALPLHRLMRALVLRRDDELRVELATLDQAVKPHLHAAIIEPTLRGLAAARIGDRDEARTQVAILRSRCPLIDAAPRTPSTPAIVYVAELAAAAGEPDERRQLLAAIDALGVTDVTGSSISFTYDGPVARVRGLLLASLGDVTAAELALRDALATATKRDHQPWVAQISHELAAVMRDAGRHDDARPLASAAALIARRLGMTGLVDGVADDTPLRVERTSAGWRFVRGDRAAVVRDSRGVQLLARLVERPGEEIHVLALASDDGVAAPASTAGEQLDDRARKAYRRRLGELGDALDDAESRGDAIRAKAIERERQTLVAELARATGLGGTSRAAASTTERARINVQKRIKDAVARIVEVDGELGAFVGRSVRTGTFCCFRP